MIRYVLHADDFGKDEGVTKAIAEVIGRGLCDETSLMVNMPFAEKSVALAHEQGFANRVGVHLNLTEGWPLTDKIRSCLRFCNANGKFNMLFHKSTTARFFLSHEETIAVREEIEAQLRKFLSFDGLMPRIDSHHHVHTNWPIFNVIRPIARSLGFDSMRISADLHRVRFDKEIYKLLFNHAVRRCFKTTDHFDGAPEAANAREGVVEVMVHPLFVNNALFDTRTPYEEAIRKIREVKR